MGQGVLEIYLHNVKLLKKKINQLLKFLLFSNFAVLMRISTYSSKSIMLCIKGWLHVNKSSYASYFSFVSMPMFEENSLIEA